MHNPHLAHSKRLFLQARGRAVALAVAAGLLATSLAADAQQAGSAPRPSSTGPANSAPAAAASSTSAAPKPVAPAGMAPAPGPRSAGYLTPGSLDILKVLPPAPVEGDTRYETDRQVFKDTRAWEGSARWKMASDDALAGPTDMLRHFSC